MCAADCTMITLWVVWDTRMYGAFMHCGHSMGRYGYCRRARRMCCRHAHACEGLDLECHGWISCGFCRSKLRFDADQLSRLPRPSLCFALSPIGFTFSFPLCPHSLLSHTYCIPSGCVCSLQMSSSVGLCLLEKVNLHGQLKLW